MGLSPLACTTFLESYIPIPICQLVGIGICQLVYRIFKKLGYVIYTNWQTMKFYFQGSINEHHSFMKEDKLLTHGTILFNVVDFLWHHIAYANSAKSSYDNLCANLIDKS
jgi:hypothetical protein